MNLIDSNSFNKWKFEQNHQFNHGFTKRRSRVRFDLVANWWLDTRKNTKSFLFSKFIHFQTTPNYSKWQPKIHTKRKIVCVCFGVSFSYTQHVSWDWVAAISAKSESVGRLGCRVNQMAQAGTRSHQSQWRPSTVNRNESDSMRHSKLRSNRCAIYDDSRCACGSNVNAREI